MDFPCLGYSSTPVGCNGYMNDSDLDQLMAAMCWKEWVKYGLVHTCFMDKNHEGECICGLCILDEDHKIL